MLLDLTSGCTLTRGPNAETGSNLSSGFSEVLRLYSLKALITVCISYKKSKVKKIEIPSCGNVLTSTYVPRRTGSFHFLPLQLMK